LIALTCPGQGAQTAGFLAPWLELESFKTEIEKYSAILEMDLVHFGTEADADQIKDTKIAQPLIVAASMASHAALISALQDDSMFEGVAGHSVGEIAAAKIAGVLDTEAALKFVKARGEQMAMAASLDASSMAAVVGGEQDTVLSHLSNLGLFAANYNGKGQIVAAGSSSKIQDLVSNPPAGTRVVGLAVAGAFHTSFMETAKVALTSLALSISCDNPKLLLWSNSDGAKVDGGDKFLDLLIKQVANPVRWDLTLDSMVSDGVSAVIELLPGGTLTGIAKRAMPGVATLALKSPEDIEKAVSFVREQAN
jgi:[acyl-carrier-protein] S-malonyltransferase